jgi:hypothetical protein
VVAAAFCVTRIIPPQQIAVRLTGRIGLRGATVHISALHSVGQGEPCMILADEFIAVVGILTAAFDGGGAFEVSTMRPVNPSGLSSVMEGLS